MEATETISDHRINTSGDICELQLRNDSLVSELESLRSSNQSLQLKLEAKEEDSEVVCRQNAELLKAIAEVSGEREVLRNEIHALEESMKEKEDELVREKEQISIELDVSRERIKEFVNENSEKIRAISEDLQVVRSIKECLEKIVEGLEGDEVGNSAEEDEEMREESKANEEFHAFLVDLKTVSKIAKDLELRFSEYQQCRKREKRELENSVVSLTEENRDINSLLRITLMEKEAVEKNLNKLKGNNEQKRGAIFQIAERGLQKVGFGFMMGAGTNEASLDSGASTTSSKSDGSECEEEAVSLASTVQRIMKNLRLEITQLRKALEESRSDTERLQSLTEKQAKKLSESKIYIKELEDREIVLAQNVEDLLMEFKTAEEEVARWREACALEVKAGENIIQQRDELVEILRQELEKTKAALHISNGKWKLKEEVAAAAMAAQAAAERSLQLTDSRAAGLRERIEELTKQLEKEEKRDRSNRHRVRHICWPLRLLKPNNPTSSASVTNRVWNVKLMIPEMQALLQSKVHLG